MQTNAIYMTIPGDPVAKGRARTATRHLKSGRTYVAHITPEKTERYEARVAIFAQQAMAGRPAAQGAVVLSVRAYFPIPPSWSKKRQQAAREGTEFHTKKPDLDNVIKALKDGMNGVVWVDDCQVVALDGCRKLFSDTPRVEVVVGLIDHA